MKVMARKEVPDGGEGVLLSQVVAFARERFIERGFTPIKMDDIAAGLHISKKTLYVLFHSKEELFEFALEQTLSGIEAEFDAIIKNRELGVLERVSAMMELEKKGYACLSRPLLEDIRRYAPAYWARINAAKSYKMEELANLTRTGMREGLFRRDINVELGMNLYAELVRSALSPDFLIRNNYSASGVNSAILHLFLHAMLSDKGRKIAKAKGLI